MPKILGFKADVISLNYQQFENKQTTVGTQPDEPTIYICRANVKETGQGLARAKWYHNVSLFLTKEEFDNQIVEVGDRLDISERAKWHPLKKTEIRTYNVEKLKNANKSKFKVDENGRTYALNYIYPYEVKAKIGDWKIDSKMGDRDYCLIDGTTLKLPITEKSSYSSDTIDYFLDENEKNAIASYIGQNATVKFYKSKVKSGEKTMRIAVNFDESANAYYLLMEKVE